MLNRYRQLRQALLIALMALMLIGVQLVQSSPLHDHATHTVDCALCHLQLSDDALIRHQLTVPPVTATAAVPVTPAQSYLSASPSPYQGRAPPRLCS